MGEEWKRDANVVERDRQLRFRDERGNLQRQHVEGVDSHLVQREINHLVELLRRIRLTVALVRVDLSLQSTDERTFDEMTIELRSIWSAVSRPWSIPCGWMKPAGLLRVSRPHNGIPLEVLVEILLANGNLHSLTPKPIPLESDCSRTGTLAAFRHSSRRCKHDYRRDCNPRHSPPTLFCTVTV